MSKIIAALLTCHNRKNKTLQCLRSMAAQELPSGTQLNVTLVDDGSTDGTSDAVLNEFPATKILHGDGSLYWCGGMRVAWSSAAQQRPDYFLLANDDTLLDRIAVSQLLDIALTPNTRKIAVAAIRDPETGIRTYGGIRGENSAVDVSGSLEKCDTFNANAVLIPKIVHDELGIFHHAYTHGMGDFDFGYLASRRGIQVIQSAATLGTCSRNPLVGTWRDSSLSRKERLRNLQSPKGLPWNEWMTFNRRNSGWKWPLKTASPYVRVMLGL